MRHMLFTSPNPCGSFLFTACILLLSGCTPKEQAYKSAAVPAESSPVPDEAIPVSLLESIADSMANNYITAGDVPGMTVAIAREGKVIFSRSYGKADVEMDVAAGPETVYNIASVTKQFTAAAIMRLVEAEKISLDDPLTKYLPDYPTQGHHVTLRHLLTHTSGIRDYTLRNEAMPNWFALDLSYKDMIVLWGNRPFDFKPGEGYDYCNMGYYLLGQVIEKVTGTPWADYAEPQLLQPLGLRHIFFNDLKRVIPNRAEGYLHEGEKLINVPYRNLRVFSAGGGLCSTVGDLIRWTYLLHNGQVVSPESLRQMTTPTVLASGDTVGYGYGLYINETGGHRKIYHGGTFGFGAYLSHYPEDGLTIGILSNSSKGRERAEQLETALARAALNVVVQDLPVSNEEIVRYEGVYTYQSTPTKMRELRVFSEDGQLKAQFGNGRALRLRSQGNHYFIPEKVDDMRIAFNVENGRAESLQIHEGRWEVTPAKRKL
ncbi:serine hydrolase domain-containing protein [Pontibacter toksunensis]|uniref:Serine hydrolase domain-containing protein n=1 Tax=Pontibacter toksunensis TaxID=1332631 RepID=A0ABW6BNI7_9BACT